MAWNTPQFISLSDMYVAFRKAKADAYYETTHFHALAFAEFERDLQTNLVGLQQRLHDPTPAWPQELTQIGTYTYMPKGYEFPEAQTLSAMHFRTLDELEEWNHTFARAREKRFKVSFRLIIKPTVAFQVITALWVLKAGHKFDACLDDRFSFGNRLRRRRVKGRSTARGAAKLNTESPGLFAPYFSAYREWQGRGLKYMRQALEDGERIIAVTMDLQSFYHRVSPSFLLRDEYLKMMGLELNEDERLFTEQLLTALAQWYSVTPDFTERQEGALPVGLSASKIIANVLLREFDQLVAAELAPVYYGRYVDDVFLVLRHQQDFVSGEAFLRWLAGRLTPIVQYEEGKNDTGPSLRMRLPYAPDSELRFVGKKQKVFDLSNEPGLDLVEHISERIRLQSSEYRLLPELPESEAEMANGALLATPDATLEANALRKADKVSIRRFGFAMLLRKVETYARDLHAREWSSLRRRFYGLVERHIITPQGFFDFTVYIHRVFRLMVQCGDEASAVHFLARLAEVVRLIERSTTAGTTQAEQFHLCLDYYGDALRQAALQASTVEGFRFSARFISTLRLAERAGLGRGPRITTHRAQEWSLHLTKADWGVRPYKEYWKHQTADEPENPAEPASRSVRRTLRLEGIEEFRGAAEVELHRPYWPALAFPTRPLALSEISLFAPVLFENPERLKRVVLALRGARIPPGPSVWLAPPSAGSGGPRPAVFYIPLRKPASTVLALSSLETTDAQWVAAVRNSPDVSLSRYRNLVALTNRMLAEVPRPDYIVLPECSLPRAWAMSIARSLARNRTSLIAGLEYRRLGGQIRNEAFISLITSWPGYLHHVCLLQSKFAPSYAEERNVHDLIGLPVFRDPAPEAKIYVHAGFCFGVLLCSDLTNIRHRQRFQGEVDALFVLEWNQDIGTFSFLIESSAHDVHTFVVQVNNRRFGDSRIRAPFRDVYQRDTVRIKGGISDYHVLAELTYESLREFQSYHRPPENGLFKPFPIGFRISDRRRRPPAQI
jgi:hypothetical protein